MINTNKIKLKIAVCLVIVQILAGCDFKMISKYPVHLAGGKDISDEFMTFDFQPRKLSADEIISVGINLKGNTICYDRHSEFRICSREIDNKNPYRSLKNVEPEELKYNPDKKYTEEELKTLKAKSQEFSNKFEKEYGEPYQKIIDSLPRVDLEVIALDSTGKEFPFVYIGSGAGYCGNENDQICNQYNFDKEINNNFTENPLVALKIRNKQAADIQISNCYIVEKYKRD